MAEIITLRHVLPVMKAAIAGDDFLGDSQKIPTLRVTHSGAVADIDDVPLPGICLAPARETPLNPPVSIHGRKTLLAMAYAYTVDLGTETGLLGDDDTLGVMEIADRLEVLFEMHLLGGLSMKTWVTEKYYPAPQESNYVGLGLNEAWLEIALDVMNQELVSNGYRSATPSSHTGDSPFLVAAAPRCNDGVALLLPEEYL